MQKTMICLARPDDQPRDEWHASVRDLVSARTFEFRACSLCIPDEQVAAAHLLEMKNTQHPKDAVISIWSNDAFQLEEFLSELADSCQLQAYAVVESEPLAREQKVGRTAGMCQVAFIKKPTAMEKQDWFSLWLGDHTKVAIETQSTFGYRQNVVAVPLPLHCPQAPAWPLMDAIVEENFPSIAMTSREAFFDAEGDSEKFEKNQQLMMQSCFKFIDFEAFDCVPMSEYLLKTI